MPSPGPAARASLRPLLAILLAVLAACAGEEAPDAASQEAPPATSSDEPLDACSLLTVDEIRAATGHDVGAGVMTGQGEGSSMCSWPSADGSNEHAVQVSVVRAAYDTYDEYAAAMAADGVMAGYRQIEGPGRFSTLIEETTIVQSYGETYMVQVTLDGLLPSGLALADGVAASVELARAALARVE
jgi:hypothetical protein